MDVLEAIRRRRSIREFHERPIRREAVERLLDAAVWAPNHRMTQPWGFIVLGPEAKARYAALRAELKTENAPDPATGERVRRRVEERTLAIPALIAVTAHQADDPDVREEDYAATWMAVQNLTLAGTELGLGTHIHTGRILEHPELRALLGVSDDERLVAVIDLGEPTEVPDPKPRTPASEKTRWLS